VNDIPKRVHVRECGPRDGLQIESKTLSVAEKIELIANLVAAGITEIEVGSLVRPDAVPQMATTPEVIASLPSAPAGVDYRVSYLNIKGLDRAAEFSSKISMEGRLAITASETFVKRNQNRTIEESFADMSRWMERYRAHGTKVGTLGVMAAFGCNFEGNVPQEKVIDIVARSEDIMAAHGNQMKLLSLMDTMGWATSFAVKSMIEKVRKRWPTVRINLHLHDTRGAAIASAVAGLEMGVDDFDGSVGGLGGCPFAGHKGAAGNICTEDFVFMCDELGIETGIDIEALIDVARRTEVVVERQLPGKVMKSGALNAIRKRLMQ
jgi:hydroxymethylglutaryl-CoA lyase